MLRRMALVLPNKNIQGGPSIDIQSAWHFPDPTHRLTAFSRNCCSRYPRQVSPARSAADRALHSPVGSHQALADQLDSHDHKSAQKNRHKRHNCAGVCRRFAGLLTHVDSRATAVLAETCLGGKFVMKQVRPAQFITRSIGTVSAGKWCISVITSVVTFLSEWFEALHTNGTWASSAISSDPQREGKLITVLRFLASSMAEQCAATIITRISYMKREQLINLF